MRSLLYPQQVAVDMDGCGILLSFYVSMLALNCGLSPRTVTVRDV